MNWNVIGDDDQKNPIADKDPESCGPCAPGLFNPINWSEKNLSISAANHLDFFLLTYNGDPALETITVTVNAPYDDGVLRLGCLVLFQQRTLVPVLFQNANGVVIHKAGAAKPYGLNSVVGLVSTEENGWAFSGDFGFD